MKVRAIIAKEHKRIHSEYEAKLQALEAERHAMAEDVGQIDRYKQLLLKQRDIMIALTARLQERDDQINTLQVRRRPAMLNQHLQMLHQHL